MARTGLKWFKHYNDASRGKTLSELWSRNDTEAIAMWWLLLELVSRWEQPDQRGFLKISYALLAKETNWKTSKCRRVMDRISSVAELSMNSLPDGNVSFLIPNWLELQERRGGLHTQNNSKEPVEVRGENQDKETTTPTHEATAYQTTTNNVQPINSVNIKDQEGTHPEPDALQPSPTFTGMVPKKKKLTSGGARVCADGRVFWRDFVSRVASVRGVDYSKHASGATAMKCKRITSIYSLEVLRSALESYVKDNDPFIEKAGWSLGVFISRLPVLVKKVEVNASTKSMYDLLNEASRNEQS